MVLQPSVGVYVASFNTCAATELCIRTLLARAGYPLELTVGDSASCDGSIEMLRRLESQGLIQVERESRPREHAVWLDSWVSQCPFDYAVFVDSDVEFRREGWLRMMIQAAGEGEAHIVAAELFDEEAGVVEPVSSRVVRAAPKPSPWLLMIDVRATRGLASFRFVNEWNASVPEGVISYDVGAKFYAEAVRRGLKVVAMPASFHGWYRHYAGLSWRRKSRDLRSRLILALLPLRLFIARTSLANRGAASVVGAVPSGGTASVAHPEAGARYRAWARQSRLRDRAG